jgi:hypothetical protein
VLSALQVLLGAGGAAAAAGEREWQVSARVGLGDVDVDGRAPLGAVAGADLEYGFTEAWAVRLSAAVGLHPVDAQKDGAAPGGTVRTTVALAGLTYTFDVLRLVPYLEGGVGVIDYAGAVRSPGATLDAELGVGADYLLTRRWAVGGLLQYQFTPLQLFGSPTDVGGSSFYFSLSARLSRLF